jgi:hypothetical protein
LEGLAVEDVGIFYGRFVFFYGQMVNFMAIWYVLWSFVLFFTVLVCCTEKHLATLVSSLCSSPSLPKNDMSLAMMRPIFDSAVLCRNAKQSKSLKNTFSISLY